METLIDNISKICSVNEREDHETIVLQSELVDSFLLVKPFVDDVNHMFLVLNRQRQIVYLNKLAKEFFKNDRLLGQRIGEAIFCIHSTESIHGCGASESCVECGANLAILNSQKFEMDKKECRITSSNNSVYDLDIWAKKITIENSDYTLVSVTDISSEKRKKVLERLFFHDVLNTAGSLRNFLELMQNAPPDEIAEFSKLSLEISNTLIDELKGQRMLGLAEDSKLMLDVTEFDAYAAFKEILNTYNNSIIRESKKLVLLNNNLENVMIKTDRTLLKRVLGNLTKNALEASSKDGEVTLAIEEFDSTIVFSVNNNSFMPRDIQHQIFQRSFSTKGNGRGIGTYSVKLLTEKYLQGEASFFSTKEFGTTFYITLPKEI